MTAPISAADFLASFRYLWAETYRDGPEKERLHQLFTNDTQWTAFIQDAGGFLDRLCTQLSQTLGLELSCHQEWSKWDVCYTNDQGFDATGGTDDVRLWPTCFYALIEHENRDNPEQEMWKLMFWRARLKVLMFYDHGRDERNRYPYTKGRWLSDKLQQFKSMLAQSDSFLDESMETEYLFLVGAWDADKSIEWRWTDARWTDAGQLPGIRPL
jgi:hypothetical protein